MPWDCGRRRALAARAVLLLLLLLLSVASCGRPVVLAGSVWLVVLWWLLPIVAACVFLATCPPSQNSSCHFNCHVAEGSVSERSECSASHKAACARVTGEIWDLQQKHLADPKQNAVLCWHDGIIHGLCRATMHVLNRAAAAGSSGRAYRCTCCSSLASVVHCNSLLHWQPHCHSAPGC